MRVTPVRIKRIKLPLEVRDCEAYGTLPMFLIWVNVDAPLKCDTQDKVKV